MKKRLAKKIIDTNERLNQQFLPLRYSNRWVGRALRSKWGKKRFALFRPSSPLVSHRTSFLERSEEGLQRLASLLGSPVATFRNRLRALIASRPLALLSQVVDMTQPIMVFRYRSDRSTKPLDQSWGDSTEPQEAVFSANRSSCFRFDPTSLRTTREAFKATAPEPADVIFDALEPGLVRYMCDHLEAVETTPDVVVDRLRRGPPPGAQDAFCLVGPEMGETLRNRLQLYASGSFDAGLQVLGDAFGTKVISTPFLPRLGARFSRAAQNALGFYMVSMRYEPTTFGCSVHLRFAAHVSAETAPHIAAETST